MKLAADTSIDILATGICAAVGDVLTTGVGPGNVVTSVTLYWQNQTANHCAYKAELAEHFQFSIFRRNVVGKQPSPD